MFRQYCIVSNILFRMFIKIYCKKKRKTKDNGACNFNSCKVCHSSAASGAAVILLNKAIYLSIIWKKEILPINRELQMKLVITWLERAGQAYKKL